MSLKDEAQSLANKITPVYKAGQQSMIDESKIIEKTVSGSIISVDDVSEIPHEVVCKVESVNLYHTDYNSGTSNGITVTRNADGSFSVSGTATGAVYIHLGYCSVNEDFAYYCSGGTSRARLAYQLSEDGKSQFTTIVSVEDIVSTGEILHSTPVKFINPVICVNSGETVNEVVKPMISLIETSEYTPYVDVSGVTVTRCGENLFNPSNLLYEHEYYPWTEKDGVYSGYSHGLFLKCQNGESAFVSNCFAPNTQYVFTFKGRVNGFTLDTGETVYEGLVFRFSYTDGSSSEITLNSADETTFTLVSTAGKTVSGLYLTYFRNVINYIKEPQLSVYIPNADTGYEPYEGQTVQANADGTVDGIKSLCPIMTVFTDNAGVNISMTYHQSYGAWLARKRFWDIKQNYGGNGDYYYAFVGSGWTDENFDPIYTIKCITGGCTYMFLWSKVRNINVDIDLSAVTTVPNLFQESEVEYIKKMIFNSDVNTSIAAFRQASNLKYITIEGTLGVDVSFQWSTKLSRASIISIMAAASTTATITITFSLIAVNTAFETSPGAADGTSSEEWAELLASRPNCTISLV